MSLEKVGTVLLSVFGNDKNRSLTLQDIHLDNKCAICKLYGYEYQYFFDQSTITYNCPHLGILRVCDAGDNVQERIKSIRRRETCVLTVGVGEHQTKFTLDLDAFNNVWYEDIPRLRSTLEQQDPQAYYKALAEACTWFGRKLVLA